MHITYPYQAIHEWWGEPLSRELANRISSSPDQHVRDFVRFAADYRYAEPSKLEPGMIRPLLKTRNSNIYKTSPVSYFNTALALLLYADEVMLEDPIHYMRAPDLMPDVLNSLLRAQPLVDAGLINFIKYPYTLDHPSRAHAFTGNLIEVLPSLPDGIELAKEMASLEARPHAYDLGQQIFSARTALGTSLGIAEQSPRTFSMLIESTEEALLLPIGIFRAKLLAPDVQTMKLAKLAALNLPVLDGNRIWAVRRSSEEFAKWRTALEVAMRYIDLMSSDDPRWQFEAKQVIASELRPIQQEIDRAVKVSPALTAMKVGAIDLGYSAVGAVTGALVGGSIASGRVGAVGGKGAEVVVKYLRSLKEQREGKAVLDLVVSFYPEDV